MRKYIPGILFIALVISFITFWIFTFRYFTPPFNNFNGWGVIISYTLCVVLWLLNLPYTKSKLK